MRLPDQPSRKGTVAITAHLDPEIRARLKILAARQMRTMNELIAEALEGLFRKHGGQLYTMVYRWLPEYHDRCRLSVYYSIR